MDASAEVKVPTAALGPLLDAHGKHVTWVNLLRSLAQNSYGHEGVPAILASPEFSSVPEVQIPNLLDRLSIGQIGIMYEFSLAYVDAASRKVSGQYFTPDDIAQFLVRQSEDFPEGVWLDPCSGVGNLSYWLAVAQEDPEAFVRDRLYLADLDPMALLVARTLFTLLFYKQDVDLFNSLRPRFLVGDFLEVELPEYDYALLNPPYAARPLDERFETAEARDIYAYFVERIIKTSKGFVSITPQSFTNSRRFASFRELLLNSFTSLHIYNFDNIPDSIFSGIKFGSVNTNTANSTRAGVIVARKAEHEERLITSLLRWPTKRRTDMLTRAPEFLVPAPLTREKFPKLTMNLPGLYEEVAGREPLSLLLASAGDTTYPLHVPASPRYFISATKRFLDRSSMHTLHFRSALARDRAYMLLNSGYMYWWWRIMDGGMTLSQETLLSLPIPASSAPDALLMLRLESSEDENLVVKMNAGKPNENVKHPQDLLQNLNVYLFGEERGSALTALGRNDDLNLLA